jgi:hypothetical protein
MVADGCDGNWAQYGWMTGETMTMKGKGKSEKKVTEASLTL